MILALFPAVAWAIFKIVVDRNAIVQKFPNVVIRFHGKLGLTLSAYLHYRFWNAQPDQFVSHLKCTSLRQLKVFRFISNRIGMPGNV